MSLLKPQYHRYIYFFGLLVVVVSIPLSNFLMSIGLFIMSGNWLIELNYIEKLKRLLSNKAALALIGIYILHVAGLLWSTDIDYALKDLRIKLPLFLVPFLVFSQKPVTKKELDKLLFFYSFAVLSGIIYVFRRMFDLRLDWREACNMISHIRFSLNICLAIFTTTYLFFNFNFKKIIYRILTALSIVVLTVALFVFHSITGQAIFIVLIIILALRKIFSQKFIIVKLILTLVIIGIVTALSVLIINIYKKNHINNTLDFNTLELYTARGNKYTHGFENKNVENGNYLWFYVCWEEIEEGWNNRSVIKFDSLDKKGQPINYTIVRYLNSKGQRKDLESVNALSIDEIHEIENGVTSVKYKETSGLIKRLENIIWEINDYKYNNDPKNHSLLQRFELWRVSAYLIADNPVIGTGTGDLPSSIADKLKELDSKLKNTPLHSHNQFLSVGIAFGLTGVIIFIFCLIYPAIKQKRYGNFLYLTFFTIMVLSMLTEDTLETQAGATFIATFNIIFLSFLPEKRINTK